VLAFMLIVAGADIAKATNFSGVAWAVLRWPLSILFLVIAVALLFKAAPNGGSRPPPGWPSARRWRCCCGLRSPACSRCTLA